MKLTYLLALLILLYINSYSQNPCPGFATVDYAGKTYNTVKIGTQCWLKENLNAGTMIQSGVSPANNSNIEKYCYNNDINNCNIYGGLYLWDEAMQYVNTPGTQGICPTGWHIPTPDEFQELSGSVGKDVWAYLEVGQSLGTNTSGFSALLAGYYSSGKFGWKDSGTSYLSSMESSPTSLYYWTPGYPDSNYNAPKSFAVSVRCLYNQSFSGINDNQGSGKPESFSLGQNYPNPFNPNTVISYSLPSGSEVKLIVYNTMGKTVKVLVNGYKNAGNYSVNFNAAELPSGSYFYKLEAGQYTQVKKLMLVK